MKFIRKIHTFVAALLAPCFLYGCTTAQLAQAEAVGASLVPLVQQGVVDAGDVYAAYQSVNQNLTAANVIQGKLSVSKVLAGAQAILGSPATAQASQSLLTAANTLVEDTNGAIATYKAAGVTSPTAITSAVSSSGAETVTSVAAIAPTAPPTAPATSTSSLWQPALNRNT